MRWRPSFGEERWLAVGARLGGAMPRAVVAARAGGWRTTGPFARVSLFVLGLVATALLWGILGFDSSNELLGAALVAVFISEWLILRQRLHASGIEEGFCVAGYLLVSAWLAMQLRMQPGGWGNAETLMLIAAMAAAGLRLSNPLVTTCAVVAFVHWAGSMDFFRAHDVVTVPGFVTFALGTAVAMLALALGALEYRRPSHDRMLDWLVAAMPIASYPFAGPWNVSTSVPLPYDSGRIAVVVTLLVAGSVLLMTGWRRRRHAPLLGSMGCIACLAAELRFIDALAIEARLLLVGVTMLVAGIVLDRYLRHPRNGVTSARLSRRGGALDLLQVAGAAVLTHRVAADSVSAAADPAMSGGGGRFGGGGATGQF